MDVYLFLAVLWRAKRLVIGGVVLGVVLALLAYGRPGFSGGRPTLTPRSAEVWQSEARVLIAQAAYPYRESSTEPSGALANLSPIYASLANGSVIQAEIRQRLGTGGKVKATEDVDLAASSFLPFVNFIATAPTPTEAARFAEGAVSIFTAFVQRQEIAKGLPPRGRIQLSVVESGAHPTLFEGHKVSIPILVFVAVLTGTVAVVLIKDNVRRRAAALAHVAAEAPSAVVRSVPAEVETASEPARAHPNGKRDGAPADRRERWMTGSGE